MKPKSEVNKAWRAKNPEAWQAIKKRHNDKSRALAKHARNKWTPEETKLIHESNLSDRELSFLLGRSRTAILVRRSKTKQYFEALSLPALHSGGSAEAGRT